ncbi:MBL fold metallo-hydrolase [bacterium]|nr:MBL fold metallo-hydrolase [bacterium]
MPICATCGTQFPETNPAPETCPICQDERQYVGLNGQPWTTLSAVQKHHANDIVQWDDGLYSIRTMPKFGIGQRAFLIQTPQGNLLWDCVSLLDEATIKQVKDLGGVDAIAISHPHYYSSMIEWSRAFGDAPIYLHENDAQWVMRKDGAIKFWSGESRDMFGQLTLIHTGGHFDGFQVLHKPGTLFAGDQPQVCMDRQWVSFMYSYPNYIPLSKRQIEHIVNKLAPLDFDQLYGAFPHQNIQRGAKEIVARSAERYIQSIA